MKIFRNISESEFFLFLQTGKIFPRYFSENPDSSAAAGFKSFWFEKPVKLLNSAAIVSINIDPALIQKSKMGFTHKNGYDLITYVIDEITINQIVAAELIFVQAWIKDDIVNNTNVYDILSFYDPKFFINFFDNSYKHVANQAQNLCKKLTDYNLVSIFDAAEIDTITNTNIYF